MAFSISWGVAAELKSPISNGSNILALVILRNRKKAICHYKCHKHSLLLTNYLFGDGVKAGCGLKGVEPKRSCSKPLSLMLLLLMLVRRAAFGGGATKKQINQLIKVLHQSGAKH